MSDPFGGFDPSMFSKVPLFQELAKVMAWTGGPVNWDLAADTAASLAKDPAALPATAGAASDFSEAVKVAELWLDQVTVLPAVDGPAVALSVAEWTRQAATPSGLGVYIEPVAKGMTGSLAEGLPEQLQGLGAPVAQAMESMSAMLYGVQAGTVAGQLAGQLLGLYDLGVPTLDPRTVGTVGDSATQFARSLDFDLVAFRYWLALREAAHRRMFAGVAWLRPRVATLIGRFAAGASFNLEEMLEGMGGMGLDPTNPEALRDALSAPDAFRVEPTAEQRDALRDLQALISFVEGWSDTVVRAAAGDKLRALPRIEEATRRRRAEKGPGERSLEQLLGLDLKPANVRVGPAFCEAVIAAKGLEGLDHAWSAEQWLPTAAELDDPSRWLLRLAAAEIEAQIASDLGPLEEPDA
jgi:putative hydrolase